MGFEPTPVFRLDNRCFFHTTIGEPFSKYVQMHWIIHQQREIMLSYSFIILIKVDVECLANTPQEIWRSLMTKALTPKETKIPKSKMPPNTSMTQRLRTVSWRNQNHTTGFVKPINWDWDLPTNCESFVIKRTYKLKESNWKKTGKITYQIFCDFNVVMSVV